jgi:hypothetical protein
MKTKIKDNYWNIDCLNIGINSNDIIIINEYIGKQHQEKYDIFFDNSFNPTSDNIEETNELIDIDINNIDKIQTIFRENKGHVINKWN